MVSQKKKGSCGSRGTLDNLVCKYVIFDVGPARTPLRC